MIHSESPFNELAYYADMADSVALIDKLDMTESERLAVSHVLFAFSQFMRGELERAAYHVSRAVIELR